jgi:hypothetical protein
MLHIDTIVNSTIRDRPLPNLQFLVEDIVTLIEILQFPLEANILESVLDDTPPRQFFRRRRQEWKRLGFSEEELDKFWGDYHDSLCDALFGLWPYSDSYLHDHEEIRSVRSILGCFDLTTRSAKDVPELDNNLFNASFIVANGPFRFKKTKYLHEHLSVNGREILLFTDLEKLAGIRQHSVLRSRHPLTAFDIMTSEDRYIPAHIVSIRPLLIRLHHSVLASLFLLFYQKPLNHHAGRVNLRIARSVGVDFGSDENDIRTLRDIVLGGQSSWDAFLDRNTMVRLQDPFMIALDRLHNVLASWRARSLWEMHHPGYGNVDLIQLYGFYFGLTVGVSGIVGILLTIAQTYAAFKALQVGQIPGPN